MEITIGTFNLNNLFSRWNFRAQIQPGEEVLTSFTFSDQEDFEIRRFMGRLVNEKDPEDRATVAQRILDMDLDVLAVQEVEDLPTLRRFARDDLGGLYPFVVLLEGNDPRLIDVALLSKLPVGASTSFRHAIHPDDPGQTVFGRDLLEVEVLNADRSQRLFRVYNNHLKSRFVPFGQDRQAGTDSNNLRRQRQAEIVAQIVDAQSTANSRYIILGDMNDPPESDFLAPLLGSGLNLVDGLANPTETRSPKNDNPPAPADGRWTHRFKPSGQPAEYELFDQIWLSPALAARQTDSFIDRRTLHGGNGSDHDPAWVVLDL